MPSSASPRGQVLSDCLFSSQITIYNLFQTWQDCLGITQLRYTFQSLSKLVGQTSSLSIKNNESKETQLNINKTFQNGFSSESSSTKKPMKENYFSLTSKYQIEFG